MKEKIEVIDFKYKVTLFTFLLFILIGALCPISGEDFKSYIIGKEGFISCFENITIKDGRFISSFLVNFFSYNKILFDFSFAFLISYFVKMCNDLMGTVKNKYAYLYPLIGVLLVSVFMFSYNYTSITSTVTYTFPTIFIFIFYYIIATYETIDLKAIIKLIILTILIGLSSIHLLLAFTFINFINIIVNYKKSNKINVLFLIIQFVLMVISLSNIKTEFLILDGDTFFNNIPSLIENVFSNNIILILIGAIPINYYLHDKLKNMTYKRVVITLFDLILVFSLGYNFFAYSPVNLNLILSKYNGIFATENWYYILYYLTYIVLFILSVNHFIKRRKVKNMFNNLIMISIILSLFLLISPIFDRGNIVFLMFTIIICSTVLSKEMEVKVYGRSTKIIATVLIIYYISMFGIIKYLDVTRNDYIKEQLEAGDTIIEVKANPIYLVWQNNPNEENLIEDFKKYYEIPMDDDIEVKYLGIFEKIEKKVKEG